MGRVVGSEFAGKVAAHWLVRCARVFAALLVLCAGANGCASSRSAEAASTMQAPAMAPGAAAPSMASGPADGDYGYAMDAREEVAQAAPPPTSPGAPPRSATDATAAPPARLDATPGKKPKLIYEATLALAVFEAQRAIDAVEALAKTSNGYLVQRSDDSITIRVPAETFDDALHKVSKLGDELHRNVSVRDVTEEFSDLEIRLQNLAVVRQRLEQLLAKAVNVEEALAVERELERVAGEMERIKGRLKLLGELVAFSTITVNFQGRPVDKVGSDVRLPFPWLRTLGLPELLKL